MKIIFLVGSSGSTNATMLCAELAKRVSVECLVIDINTIPFGAADVGFYGTDTIIKMIDNPTDIELEQIRLLEEMLGRGLPLEDDLCRFNNITNRRLLNSSPALDSELKVGKYPKVLKFLSKKIRVDSYETVKSIQAVTKKPLYIEDYLNHRTSYSALSVSGKFVCAYKSELPDSIEGSWTSAEPAKSAYYPANQKEIETLGSFSIGNKIVLVTYYVKSDDQKIHVFEACFDPSFTELDSIGCAATEKTLAILAAEVKSIQDAEAAAQANMADTSINNLGVAVQNCDPIPTDPALLALPTEDKDDYVSVAPSDQEVSSSIGPISIAFEERQNAILYVKKCTKVGSTVGIHINDNVYGHPLLSEEDLTIRLNDVNGKPLEVRVVVEDREGLVVPLNYII